MTRLCDIARETGLSTTTVSLVLSGKAERYRIGADTIKRVKTAAQRRSFTPNQLARSLRTRRTGTIGLVVADITAAFFSQLAREIEIAAQHRSCHVIIANTNDQPDIEREAIRTLLGKSVDGLIVSSVNADGPLRGVRVPAGFPVVYLDRVVAGSRSHSVTTDNARGMRELTRAVAGFGVRDIAYVGGLEHLSTHRDRLEGFMEGVREAGIERSACRVLEGGFGHAFGVESAQRLFGSTGQCPDAVITAALPLFEGILAGARSMGVDIRATRFGTFDDHPLLDHLSIDVPSVRQDCSAMGRAAFDAVTALANGERVPHVITIAPTLINRPRSKEA